MAAIVSAIDSAFERRVGEKGHVEHGWSKNIEEKILQYYFQLVRSNGNITKFDKQREKYNELLNLIFSTNSVLSETEKINYAKILFKLIAQTRDIIAGKGEYRLTYMMISCWANAFKLTNFDMKYEALCLEAAKYALKSMVISDNNEHPLGSWKDIKYFLNYLLETQPEKTSPIFEYAIELINNQLKQDAINDATGHPEKLSLAAKWVPREGSSKFGWITPYLAENYFKDLGWTETCKTPEQHRKLRIKFLTHYRQLISKLNKQLDTTQIKQCDLRWREIDFEKKVTSITIAKQKSAFFNNSRSARKNEERETNEDRVICAQNFKEYISKCSSGKTEIKGKRVSIYDFVRDALQYDDDDMRNVINLQWEDNAKQNGALEKMIAMVDVSGSMSCDNNTPLYNAIGIGIRIAQKSTIGKRVLTFSATPNWVDLDDCNDLCSAVNKVRHSDWGMTTNFYAAFDKILQAYSNMNVDPDQVENVCLVILSDMQIDAAEDKKSKSETMFEVMEAKFADAGITSKFNKPYKLPTIVFWNLRLTEGFPSTAFTKNTVMVSGYSPALLNLFTEKGVDAFKEITPWTMFIDAISHSRYNSFDGVLVDLFSSRV